VVAGYVARWTGRQATAPEALRRGTCESPITPERNALLATGSIQGLVDQRAAKGGGESRKKEENPPGVLDSRLGRVEWASGAVLSARVPEQVIVNWTRLTGRAEFC
jgi:hypothetical protein